MRRTEEERQVEVLLPTDLLVHTFAFLSVDSLSSGESGLLVLRACRLCSPVVRLRIRALLGNSRPSSRLFTTCKITMSKLRKLDADVPRAALLIASVSTSQGWTAGT